MSSKYYIRVSDGTLSLTFDVTRDEAELPVAIHYYIGLAHKTYKACVHIEADIGRRYAVLQGVAMDSECSMEGDMQTIHLLVKGALKHVAKKHTINHYSLDDKAEKHLSSGKSIAITPRLLLQGKEGWYQRHFGAIPTQDTYRILQSLAKHTEKLNRFSSITMQENWGSDDEIVSVAEKVIPQYAGAIFGTSWIIQRDVVDKYDVAVEELQYGGGGKSNPKWNTFLWYLKKVRENPVRRVRGNGGTVSELRMRLRRS